MREILVVVRKRFCPESFQESKFKESSEWRDSMPISYALVARLATDSEPTVLAEYR